MVAILSRDGLITSKRRSRSIIYRTKFETVRAAINEPLKDCCAAHRRWSSVLSAAEKFND